MRMTFQVASRTSAATTVGKKDETRMIDRKAATTMAFVRKVLESMRKLTRFLLGAPHACLAGGDIILTGSY